MNRTSLWRRATRLDWWIDPLDADRYRRRKLRGTRVPLNEGGFGAYGRGYLVVFVAAVMVGAGGVGLVRGSSPWSKAAGVLLLVVLLGAAVLVVRYARLPVDEEFTQQQRADGS